MHACMHVYMRTHAYSTLPRPLLHQVAPRLLRRIAVDDALIHTYIYMHADMYIYACMHIHIHAYIQTDGQTCILYHRRTRLSRGSCVESSWIMAAVPT